MKFLRKMFGTIKLVKPTNVQTSYINLHANKLNHLTMGDEVEDFELTNSRGEIIRLYDVLKHQTVMISFFRGTWCPQCNLHLCSLQDEYNDLIGGGVRMFGISPDPIQRLKETKSKHDLSYELLSDPQNKAAHSFGIVANVEQNAVRHNKKLFEARFKEIGPKGYEVPIPAIYIIDKNHIINYSFLDTDYTVRLHPATLVDMVYAKA